MVVYEVLKVLYSPVKAFEEIVKKPSVKGPLLVLALTLLATVVLQSVVASKYFRLTATPDNDDWTESVSLWNSNGERSVDGTEGVVGNYSVKSSVTNNVDRNSNTPLFYCNDFYLFIGLNINNTKMYKL